jgi:hypothetical protein
MSDAFWAGLFIALPAIVASVLAYRKSEIAALKAENVESALKTEITNGRSYTRQDVMSTEEVTRAIRLIVQELAQQDGRIQTLERKLEDFDTNNSLPQG